MTPIPDRQQSGTGSPRRLAFLIVGSGHGGTSLLAAMLDGHPELRVANELHQNGILMGRGRGWVRRSPHERLDGFLRACDDEAARHPDVLWGNKVVAEAFFIGAVDGTSEDAAAAEDLVSRLPRVPIIYIVRDGRAVVRSKVARSGLSLERACSYWRRSIELLDRLRGASWPMVALRYEQLVREPDVELARACTLLGVAFSPLMLEQTDNELLLPEYRYGRLEPWRAEAVEALPGSLELIAEHLERAGYGEAVA